jgi:membrane protein YqaA with SNARE-associated domain
MIDLAAYGSLFLAALAAATIVPMQSEAVLVGLLLAGEQPAWLLVLIASIGNVLGSVVNWGLGRWIHRWRDRPWFPVKPDALARAEGRYRRWGRWSLLLSWAPIIGDPLTVVAGVLREPSWVFLALVAIAKTGRYISLTLLTLGLVPDG